jgi:hypothetical protein
MTHEESNTSEMKEIQTDMTEIKEDTTEKIVEEVEIVEELLEESKEKDEITEDKTEAEEIEKKEDTTEKVVEEVIEEVVKEVEIIENTTEAKETEIKEDTTEKVVEEIKAVVDEPKEIYNAPVNKEALQKQESEFSSLKLLIENLESGLEKNDDPRSVRKVLVGLKEGLASLFLISSDEKNEFDQRIQNVFELVSEKQTKEREERNVIFEGNYSKINPVFDEKISEANKILETDFKGSRAILIALQKEIKGLKLRPSHRDIFFKTIQDLFDKIKVYETAEREAYEMECAENFLQFKPKVENICKKEKESENLNDSRKNLIALQKELREIKLSRKERDELYGIIRASFDEINSKQDAQRKEFKTEALKNYEIAKPITDEAIAYATDPKNINVARNHLIEAQKKLKNLRLTRQQSDELFGAIRGIFSKINENPEETQDDFKEISLSNFAKLELKINEAIANVEYSSDFRDIREGLIDVQDEVKIVKLTRSHRNELLARIRKGFKKFDAKRKDFTQKRQNEKRLKLDEILRRLERNNESLKKLIDEDVAASESVGDEEKRTFEQKIISRQKSIDDNQKRIDDIKNELSKIG